MNTLESLLPLISAKLGRNLGPSADWIGDAFLVYENSDESGGWYLIDEEEKGDVLSLGFIGDAGGIDTPLFEVETEIPFADIPAWLESGLPAFLEKCRAIDAEDSHRYTREPAALTPSAIPLRDYFAGQAIASLIPMTGITMPSGDYATHKDRAKIAYEIADAMLAAR